MSQIASINSNQSVFATNSLVNFALEPDKELPKWLIEFNSFGLEENSAAETKQARPLTESHLRNRPKWFDELSQKRRMSQFTAMEGSGSRVTLTTELSQTSQNNTKIATLHPHSPIVEVAEHENEPRLPSQRRFSSEMIFLVPNSELSKPSYTTSNSFSDESNHSSLLADADGLEDEIMAFTTSKSMERLRINELVVPELDECIIPEMPRGSELTLSILENWGDDNFIGINGIELLDPLGKRPVVQNIFLQDGTNARHKLDDLSKLVDNVYRTHDDSHIWQYRVRKDQMPLQIVLQMSEPVTIALLRIWNYNKSRIHSYRGVKYMQIRLNGQLIFSGEIAKATGDLTGSVENFGDTILFTTNESIIEQISKYDTTFQELLMEQMQ